MWNLTHGPTAPRPETGKKAKDTDETKLARKNRGRKGRKEKPVNMEGKPINVEGAIDGRKITKCPHGKA